MSLTEKEKNFIVEHRIKRAGQTLAEAKELIRQNHWHGSANRLYYACFYAVTALLAKHGHTAHTHGGVLGLFGKHFVATGIVSKEKNKFYQRLFDLRGDADYGDGFDFSEDDVKPMLIPVEKFIAEIEKLLK